MAKEKRLTKEELKAPDSITHFFSDFIGKLSGYKNPIFIIGSVLIIALGLFVYRGYLKTQHNQAAADAYYTLSEKLQAENTPSNEEKVSLWREFLKEYDGSSMAGLGALGLASAQFNNRNWDEAAQSYAKAQKMLAKPFSYQAIEGLAKVHEEKNDLAAAATQWKQLVQIKENPTRDYHLWRLALTLEAQDNKEQAVTYLEELISEYEDSPYFQEAQAYLPRLKS